MLYYTGEVILNFEFKNRELERLYTTGKSRKYKLHPQVLKKFFMRVQQIEAAQDIYDLWRTPALKFERLRGYVNRFSIRLDIKWRLEIQIEWENEQKTRGKVYILEISSHYGD